MSQNVIFENHFSARVVEIFFTEGFSINNEQDLFYLKSEWTKNLKSWHSPYTCLFDLRKFQISSEMYVPFFKMLQFFSNFFMRKFIGFCDEKSDFLSINFLREFIHINNSENKDEVCFKKENSDYEESIKKIISFLKTINFQIIQGYEQAILATGLAKGSGLKRDLGSLRSRIQIDNDFNAHVMEIQFLAETHLNSKEDILVLKEKVKNILRQWHTPYSILFNCVNLSFALEAFEEFLKFDKFVKNFFCKQIIGYAPKDSKDSYPFLTFRSRHLAAAELENSGLKSGAVANCATKKI